MNHPPFVAAAGEFCNPTLPHSYNILDTVSCSHGNPVSLIRSSPAVSQNLLGKKQLSMLPLAPVYTVSPCGQLLLFSCLVMTELWHSFQPGDLEAHCRPPTPSPPQAPASLYTPHSKSEVSHFIQVSRQAVMLICHQRQHVARWM